MSFLERILESERAAVRTLATEITAATLERSEGLIDGADEDARAALVKKLLVALVRRCVDVVATVRSHAVGGVAAGLQFLSRVGKGSQLLRELTAAHVHPHHIDIAGLFRHAAVDEKPTVRKAALSFFDASLPLLSQALALDVADVATFFDVKLFASLSADESVLVRKSSISSLTLLLRTCPCPNVCKLWIRNVLPLVVDVEASVA